MISKTTSDSEWNNWLIDISAGCISITLTALIVDYLIYREKKTKNLSLTAVIFDELDAILAEVVFGIAVLFGHKFSYKKAIRIEALEFLDQHLVPNNEKHLLNERLPEKRIMAVSKYFKTLLIKLDEFISINDAYLESDLANIVYVHRRHLKRVIDLADKTVPTESTPEAPSLVVGMATVSMYGHLKHFYFNKYTTDRVKKISLHRFGRVNKFAWAMEDLWAFLKKELDLRAAWKVPSSEKDKSSRD